MQRRAASLAWQSIGALLPLLCVLAPGARGATHLVRPDGTGDFPTIQAALGASAGGDTVLLADGVFRGPGNRDLDFRGRAIVLASQSRNADACVIDCQAGPTDPHRGLFFHSAEGPGTAVEDLTVTGAYAPVGSAALVLVASPTFRRVVFAGNPSATAGAVYVLNGSPTLEHCTFRGNVTPAGSGAAFYCKFGGAPRLTGCKFFDNQAREGGAVYSRENASPVYEDCIWVGNRGADGGGLMAADGTRPTLIDCVFDGNQAGQGGAMLLGEAADAVLSGCEFSRNRAVRGGALFVGFAAPVLTECRMTENQAGSRGGAVLADSGAVVTMMRCTLAANEAAWDGGAAYARDAALRLESCTLSGNAAGDSLAGGIGARGASEVELERTIIAFGHRGAALRCDPGAGVALRCCDVFGNAGGDFVDCLTGSEGGDGNISADPLFCSVGGGEFMLDARSPCIARVDARCGPIGAWGVGCGTRAGDVAAPATAPRAGMERPGPNPFTGSTRILLTLPPGVRQDFSLAIYDAAGRRVRRLLEGRRAAGGHALSWDGTDDAGRALAAGVYLCRLRVGDEIVTRAVTLIR